MARRTLIAGNWKMNLMVRESVDLAEAINQHARYVDWCDVAIFPPAINIYPVFMAIDDHIICGAQNMYQADSGAYTGEISGGMIAAIGLEHVLIGHSERRHVFGETDDVLNLKLKKALSLKLVPVFCIGETLDQRNSGETESVLRSQIELGLAGIKLTDPKSMIIAYEPVWAIGTGLTATPQQAQEAQAFVRSLLPEKVQDEMRILYGGSVKPGNAAELLAQPDIDGALVGGASLDAESFIGIIDAAKQ